MNDVRRRLSRRWLGAGLSVAGALVALGCGGQGEVSSSGEGSGGTGNGEPPHGESPLGPAPTFDSLDLSSVGPFSTDWCNVPEFTPSGFTALDKETLAQLLAEYTVGWMTPMHEGLGALDERALFHSTFEMIWATFDTGCNWNTDEDLTFGDDGLLDAENRQEAYDEVFGFVQDAVEIQTGETLRLSVHDCEACAEPLGAQPFFVNARLTTDGVLMLTVELTEGVVSETYYITPDVIVVHAELGPFSEWVQQVDESTRSGEVLVADAAGTVTGVAYKNASGTFASVGLSNFSLDSKKDTDDNIRVTSSTPCIGMHTAVHTPSSAVQGSMFLGDLQGVVPGHVQCDGSTDCGALEEAENWTYAVDALYLAVDQPDDSSAEELALWVNANSTAAARLGAETFAEWQVGSERSSEHQALTAAVDEQDGGYLVTFNPPLGMRGAMTISKFSDEFRATLPSWLEDEIFDVTFGGDPTASVFVPRREMCNDDSANPQGQDPPEPPRRQVRVVSGTFEAEVGSGLKTATEGQCGGATLLDESELGLTSDFAEIGFVCQ